MTSYEVPSDERTQRRNRRDIDRNRQLARFSANNSKQADQVAFGAGSHDNATGVVTGNFVMNPEIHIECIELDWTGATGTLDIGDIVDTTNNGWQGKLLHIVSGDSTAGKGVFEPQNTTAFAEAAQTLSVGSTWTGATYTASSLDTGSIVTQAASIILDTIDGSDPELKNIHGAKNDGQFTTVRPKEGKTAMINTGGNLDVAVASTVEDTTFLLLQYHEDAGNKWQISGSGGTGSSSGNNAIKTQVRATTTGVNNILHPVWGDVFDGVTVVEGDRILIKDQTTQADNGIYVVGPVIATVFTATRASDFDNDAEVKGGVLVAIEEGTVHGDQVWMLTTNNPITVGTTALTFANIATSLGDDLGNHTATEALKMGAFGIENTSEIEFLGNPSNQLRITARDTSTPDGTFDRLEYHADNLGAHDFYVDAVNTTTPRFGITETSIESNVKFDMNLNEIDFDDISTPSTDAARAKIYAKLDGGVIKTYTLWSDGTEKELGGAGGGASVLNDLTDVTLTGTINREHLEYNGTVWVNTGIFSQNNNSAIRWRNAGDTDWASINVNTSDEFNFNPATGTTEVQFNSLALTGVAHIETDSANRPSTGFLQMSSGTELVWRNPANTDNLIFDNGLDALSNQAFIFNVAGGNQLTISETDIDVLDNDILNTGDIEAGTGASYDVGTTGNPYLRMFSNFFIPEAATVITNRYGLAKTGNTLYVNFDNTNGDAGFSIYEEGFESFRFYHPTSTVNEFHIGSSAAFTAGETYRIQMGESSTSSGSITYVEGTGNDVIIDRAGAGVDQGVQIRGAGLSIARFLSASIKIFQPLDANAKDLFNVVDIKSNGGGVSGTGVIGELITNDGGFNYFMRDTLAWESDADMKLTMASTGITLETNGTSDDIEIKALGATSDLTLTGTGQVFMGLSGVNSLTMSTSTATFSGKNLFLTNGAEEIQFADAVAGASATTPAAGDINLFNDLTTGELSVKKPGGTVVSLEGGGGSQTPWTSDIDADGFDLNDLSNIEFRTTSSPPASSLRAIWANTSTNISYGTPNGGSHSFIVDGTTRMAIFTNNVEMDVNLHMDGNIIRFDTSDDVNLFSPSADTLELNLGDVNKDMIFTDNTIETNSNASQFTLETYYDDSSPGVDTVYAQYVHRYNNSSSSSEIFSSVSHIARDETVGTEDSEILWHTIDGGNLDEVMSWGDSETNANGLVLQRNSNAIDFWFIRDESTPTTGNIGLIEWHTNKSTGPDETFAHIHVSANTITNGAEDVNVEFDGMTNGTMETYLEFDGNNGLYVQKDSGGKLSFFNDTPVTQRSVASDTLANLYTALRSYGLIA